MLDVGLEAMADADGEGGSHVLEVPLDEDANETIEIDLEVTDVEVSVVFITKIAASFSCFTPPADCSRWFTRIQLLWRAL